MWSLASPLALLLLPLPLLARPFLPPRAVEPAQALPVPEDVARALDLHAARGGRGMPPVLPWLAWALLVLAMAGPQITRTQAALPTSGREIYLAIDLSGSMGRDDFLLDGRRTSRIDAVRQVAGDFIARRAGDRIGLALFAEKAYLAAPASFDLALVRQALQEAQIGVVGTSTAIGDGLGLALKRLRDSEARSRLIVLLSDGTNTAGVVRPEEAARLAADLGIRVHTIALGTVDKTDGPGAEADAVDYPALRAIAQASGGEAFRVRTTEELSLVYAEIEALEATGAAAPPASIAWELWPYAAAAAYLALLGLILRPEGAR
jgi:Ca-activated chloride channel family protein